METMDNVKRKLCSKMKINGINPVHKCVQKLEWQWEWCRSGYWKNDCVMNAIAICKFALLKPMDSFGMWWKSNEIIFLHWIIIL